MADNTSSTSPPLGEPVESSGTTTASKDTMSVADAISPPSLSSVNNKSKAEDTVLEDNTNKNINVNNTNTSQLQPSLPIIATSTKKEEKPVVPKNTDSNVAKDTSSAPSTPLSAAPPAPLSATSQYSTNTLSATTSPTASYSLENCSFNELKTILSEKLIQLSQVQNQNAQLWTLVNKQRTMIFDLQRDFDNAVEQNEKLAKQLENMKSANSTQPPHQVSSPSPYASSISSVNNNSQSTSGASSPNFAALSATTPTFKVSRKPSKRDVPPPATATTASAPALIVTDAPQLSAHKSDPTISAHRAPSYRKPVTSTASSTETADSVRSPKVDQRYSNGSLISIKSSEKPILNTDTLPKAETKNPYNLPSETPSNSNSSSNRTTKPRPPPIHLPEELATDSEKTYIVNDSTTPSTPATSLKVTSSQSASFDFTSYRGNESDKHKIVSPRNNDTLHRQPLVLYVEPNDLSSISLDISTLIGKVKSTYKPRREDPIAIINALDRETKKELWKVIKDYTALYQFDSSIRTMVLGLPRIPDKSLFQSHAPQRVDSRKTLLEEYFNKLLSEKLPQAAAQIVCEFLSTDTVDPMDIPDMPSRCEGYLTKRGKKLRTWRVRYFVIEGNQLNYYDKPGGELQGSISLRDAKLGKQIKNDTEPVSEESMDKSFRHAFLLLEQRKRDYVRHVLCAESDNDRDHWLDALLEVISENTSTTQNQVTLSSSHLPTEDQTSPVRKLDENTRLASIPPSFTATNTNSPITPTAASSMRYKSDQHSLHDLRPTGSAATYHSYTDDADFDDEITKENKKPKKKGFFSFRNKSSTNTSSGLHSATNEMFNTEFQSTPYSAVEQQPMPSGVAVELLQATHVYQQAPNAYQPNSQAPPPIPPRQHDIADVSKALDDHVASQNDIVAYEDNGELPIEMPSRRIFGIPLTDAVQLSYKDVHHCRVPSIVYRCIELLKIRDAIYEEGIFRLSGSSATIRTLKEKFNNEYDIDLVNSETYYDIHAVAGLLKLYLREIPTLILSSYLAPEFRDTVEIQDVTTRILKLKSLVQELPRENRDLLCVLCSLLTEVIAHQDLNKMNLRNVGIVFSLTLNVSSSVLTSFLIDFDSIFGDAAPDETKVRAVVDFPKMEI